jgi:hypothetical protein
MQEQLPRRSCGDRDDCMDAGGRATQERLPKILSHLERQDACHAARRLPPSRAPPHDCTDAGGTSPRMDEVGRSRKPEPRATHGAVAEASLFG